MKKVVCLHSGGLDSSVVLYSLLAGGYEVYPINFKYGQRHKVEATYAKRLLAAASKRFPNLRAQVTVNLALSTVAASALTRADIAVPLGRSEKIMSKAIPVTYVPARNTVFLSIALAYAESIGASLIYTGFNAVDYSGYPDCRPAFVSAYNRLIKKATKKGDITVKAPLIKRTKIAIVRKGRELGVPFDLTWSCYSGGKTPCGQCDSCKIRDAALSK